MWHSVPCRATPSPAMADGRRSSWPTFTSSHWAPITCRRRSPVTAAELLVIVGRRTVLRRLPDLVHDRGRFHRLALGADAHGHRLGRRHRRLVLVVDRPDGLAPGYCLFLAADPRLGARSRGPGGREHDVVAQAPGPGGRAGHRSGTDHRRGSGRASSRNRVGPGLRPFGWLGQRSYSLYLWHWPILI